MPVRYVWPADTVKVPVTSKAISSTAMSSAPEVMFIEEALRPVLSACSVVPFVMAMDEKS